MHWMLLVAEQLGLGVADPLGEKSSNKKTGSFRNTKLDSMLVRSIGSCDIDLWK